MGVNVAGIQEKKETTRIAHIRHIRLQFFLTFYFYFYFIQI